MFVNNVIIGSLFKFKDCLSLDMKSHVVYRLDCMSYPAGYIHWGYYTRLLPAKVKVLQQWQNIHYGRDTAWTGLMLKS